LGVCTLLPDTKAVAITATLQMTAAEFEKVQDAFVAAVAASMSADVSAVAITNVTETAASGARRRRRSLLAPSIDVEFTVTVTPMDRALLVMDLVPRKSEMGRVLSQKRELEGLIPKSVKCLVPYSARASSPSR